jgi:NADPH:quinone reductase-like Zn-dependent oxidoreductase
MQALAIAARDAAPDFLEVPDPEPGPGEVLAALEAASINGLDAGIASGMVWDALPHTFPVVLGRDFAGTVAAVGEDVDHVSAGDRVAGVLPLGGDGLGRGTLAELVVAPASAAAVVPAEVSSADAAAVGLAGVAALDAIDAIAVADGDLVLVCGATGGVGHIAVQLAVHRGATVIATAKPGEADRFVRSIGATHVVDHTGDVAAQARAVAPEGVDKALHAAGDPAAVAAAVRTGGTLASTLGATAAQIGRDDLTVSGVFATPTTDKVATLLGQVANGQLRVHIGSTVPFDRATDALAAFSGALGKVVVTR